MLHALARFVACAALTFVAAPPATCAQAPKAGGYEEFPSFGFKIKVPKDWEYVPPTPLERNNLGKWAPGANAFTRLKGNWIVSANAWLLKFDERPESDDGSVARTIGGKETKIQAPLRKNVLDWIEKDMGEGSGWHALDDKKFPKDLRTQIPGEFHIYEGEATNFLSGGNTGEPQVIHAYAAVFSVDDGLKIALVGLGPGDKKSKKFESAFSKLAKSIRPIDVEASGVVAASGSPRDQKRAKLERTVEQQPGWRLEETENYFIVTNNDDHDFIEELAVRVEAIRAVYAIDYPPEMARQVKVQDNSSDEDDEDEEEDEPEVEDRSISVVNMLELSRTSVIRVCKDANQYRQYGGPPRSAGYWNWVEEELVVYDDKASGGRNNTWATMNHEAFHQYIFYFYGNISPHSWYNEGTGDFYAGYAYKYKRFNLEKFSWRTGLINEMLNEERFVPLREFVRWSKAQYYNENPSSNPYGVTKGDCYAQGWAFIWFLRTGKENRAKGWNDDWDDILSVYLDTLARTGDLEKAVDEAFADIDWDAFEAAWLHYTKN